MGSNFLEISVYHAVVVSGLLAGIVLVLLGLLRYFAYLLPQAGASLGLVLRQVAAGTLLTCLFSFVAYFPMRRISRLFADR